MVTSEFKTSAVCITIMIFALALILSLSVFIFTTPNIFDRTFWNQESLFVILAIALPIQILAIAVLFRLKEISIEKDRIIFQSFLFPSSKRECLFSDYEYSKTVEMESENGIYESLWLIREGKVKDSISSFYYKNYNNLKNEIKIQHKGKLDLSPIKQLKCMFGGEI